MLNLDHLKYFCDAVRAKSVAKAAAMNRVSHPAVSQAIRSLEARLNTTLLVHAKRRFEVTSQGMILYKRSEKIFAQLDETVHALGAENDVVQGPLGLGCSHSLGLSLGRKIFPEFCQAYPQVDLALSIGNSRSLEALLDSRAIEIGFGVDDGSFSRFEKVTLKKGKFILFGRAPTKGVPTYLVGDKGLEVSQLRAKLRQHEPDARFVEIQSWELIAQMATSGMGYGLIPDYILESELFSAGKTLETSYKLPSYEVCAFFRSRESLSTPAKRLLEAQSRKLHLL